MIQNKNRLIFLITLFLFWITLSFTFFSCDSTHNNKIIARIENETITLSEFRDRLNNILLHTTQPNPELRDALLENLINEKVLIIEAEKRGYTQTEEYSYEAERLKTDIILDQYRDYIANKKITVTEKDVEQAFALQHEQVRARILFARNEDDAYRLHNQLMNGASFNQLAKVCFKDPALSQNGGDMGYFSWDDTELPFAEAAQQLKIGDISKPVLTRNGWYIIKVEDRFRPPLTETDYHKEYKKLKWKVTHRKKAKAIREYTKEIADKLNISFNEHILAALIKEVPIHSSDNEFLTLGFHDDDTVAIIAGKPLTVSEFYEKARWTSYRQRRSIKDIDGVKRFIEGLAVRDILLSQAKEKGFDRDKELQKKIDKFLDLFLINKMNSEIMDTVQVDSIAARHYYDRFKDQFVYPKRVNIREILVDTEKKALHLLKRLEEGEDFSELARRYSLRKWSAKRGGELGYGTLSQYGIHGKKIFAMKGGEIGGPFKTDSYYSIIQVIDFLPGRQKTFEEAKQEIGTILIDEKKRNVLLETIEGFKNGLNIEYNLKGI